MSLKVLENQMISVINSLTPREEFLLKDIITNPPALLGRHLYEKVQRKEISNVEYIGKVAGVDKYRKI